MAHVELMVADAYSPDLLRFCAKNGIVATPNRDKKNSVLFYGEYNSLIKLIRGQFVLSEEDYLFLIDSIEQ